MYFQQYSSLPEYLRDFNNSLRLKAGQIQANYDLKNLVYCRRSQSVTEKRIALVTIPGRMMIVEPFALVAPSAEPCCPPLPFLDRG